MADFPQSGKWSLREHAHRLQGDMSYPTTSIASSRWSLTDVSRNEGLDRWPQFIDAFLGSDYAASYIATTGGSITNFGATSGSLNSAIDALSDGDVLLLQAGSYTLTSVQSASYTSCPWRNANVLIAGDVADPNDVVIELTHSADRGKHIFGEGSGTDKVPSINKQMAFCRLKRLATSPTSYVNALAIGYGANPAKGRMVNCILDLNDSYVSWTYDNATTTDHDVKFIRTTFLNYNAWQASYTGSTGIIKVDNCVFDDTTQETDRATLTDCETSVSVTISDGSYSTATYTTAGHLYVPNATAIF
jgi:hypothetical protein